jgi:hypothetical protein
MGQKGLADNSCLEINTQIPAMAEQQTYLYRAILRRGDTGASSNFRCLGHDTAAD